LFTASVDLALDAVPKQIDIEKVQSFLKNSKGVKNIHDLHVWAMSTSQVALSVHLYMPEGAGENFLKELQINLKNEFGIIHTTIQIEYIEIDCESGC
jgi:cobalt-zinc-cadmium efflux system protein